jgi:6-pyruvoyltetrahydropterin/6-carboxytetrahydropterin synthase
MHEIKVLSEFSGAHRLRYYKGKCEDLHGHNWNVEVLLRSATLDKKGMIIDFKELKQHIKRVLDLLDHKLLNDLSYFNSVNPTSENIAQFIYEKLKTKNPGLMKVTVWETATSAASYYETSDVP